MVFFEPDLQDLDGDFVHLGNWLDASVKDVIPSFVQSKCRRRGLRLAHLFTNIADL